MKKIIKGKLYNTVSATVIGQYENEVLYQKKTGEFFLWIGGSNPAIKPISYDAAREWAAKHIDDKCIKLFGEPEEDTSKVKLTLHIRRDLVHKVKQSAAKSGKTVSEYIEDMINVLYQNHTK